MTFLVTQHLACHKLL